MRKETLIFPDIETMLEDTDKADIERVLSNLLDGSYNHLDAFMIVFSSLAYTGGDKVRGDKGQGDTGTTGGGSTTQTRGQ